MGGGASKESEEKERKLQNEVRELQQKQKQLEDEKRQQEQALQDEQKRLERLQAEQDKAKEERDAAAAELKVVAEQRDGLEEQVVAARQETEQLKALLPASELPEDTKLAEIHELEEQSKELANMLDELEGQRSSNQAEKEKLQKELEEALGTTTAAAKGVVKDDETGAVRKSDSSMQRVESATSKPAEVKDLSQLRKLATEGPQEVPESDAAEVEMPASPSPARQAYVPDVDDGYDPADHEPYAADEMAEGGAFVEGVHPSEEVSRIRARLAQLESQEEQLEEKANSVRKRRQDVDTSLGRYAPDAPGRIKEAWQRGVTLGSLLDFFVENCGEVSFEPSFFGSDDDWRRPLCVATKLNRKCHQTNQENRAEIAKKRLRALLPNVFAVEKLFIRPLTEERRCSMAELWSTEPVDAVHASPGTGVGRVIVTGLDSNVAEELESFYSLAGGAISLKAILKETTQGGFIVDEDSIQTSKIEHSDLKEVIFSVSAATPRLYSLPRMPELSPRKVWFPLAALGALASAFALVALRCRFRHGAEGNDLLVPASDSDLEPGEQ